MKIRASFICSAVAAATLATVVSATAQQPPSLRIRRAAAVPKIDGKLNDVCWRLAPKVKDFRRSDGAPAQQPTTAYFTYDNENLYIAFRCSEPEPDKLVAEGAKDGSIWGDDLVDFFIHADPKGKLYYQFAVNAKGVKFDQEKGYGSRDTEGYNPEWDVATHIGTDHWSAEVRLPLKAIGAESQIGRTWRMNFCRHRAGNKENSTWAPVEANWHAIGRFGFITGMVLGGEVFDKGRVQVVDVALDGARIGANDCRVRVKNSRGAPVQLTITTEVASPHNKKISFTREVTIAKRAEEDVAVPYQLVPVAGRHVLTFVVSDAKTGAKYHVSPHAYAHVPSFLSSYLDRSYYTTEKEARVYVEIGVAQENLKDYQLRMALKKDGKTLKKKVFSKLKPVMKHVFALSARGVGDYTVVSELLNRKRAVLATATERLQKLPPVEHEVKIDRERRILLLNNKPHFVLGMYLPPISSYEELGKAHFNNVTYLYHGSPKPKGIPGAIAAAETALEHGLYSLFSPVFLYEKFRANGNVRGNLDAFDKAMPDFTQAISGLKDLPQLCWFGFDEPGGAIGEKQSQGLYRAFKKTNPYLPVLVVFAHKVQFPLEGAADIVCIDNYYDPKRNDVTSLVPRAEAASVLAKKDHLPYFVVPQANLWSGSKQSITPKEQRFSTYLALSKGATGIIWFSWVNKIYKELWDEIKTLTGEMHEMAPMLLTLTPGQNVTASPDSRIHLLVKEYEGDLYLIAVNASRQASDVTFSLPALGESSTVSVLFEDRNIKAKGNHFTDKFSGCGTHVYRMKRKVRHETYEIAVTEKKLAEHWDPMAFFNKTKATYRNGTIDLRGTGNTLASIAKDLNDPKLFAYDPETRTAIAGENGKRVDMIIAPGSRLVIGHKDNPELGESLVGVRGEIEVSGRLEIYNSRLLRCGSLKTRYDIGRIVIHDTEVAYSGGGGGPFGAKRPKDTRTYDIYNVDIHNCNDRVFYLGQQIGPFVNCRIHDNPRGLGPAGLWSYVIDQKAGKIHPRTFIDCELSNNPLLDAASIKAFGDSKWIYINTTDDNLDKYVFDRGYLVRKWHVTVKAKNKAGKPLAGLDVWIDAAGKEQDEQGVTGTDGVCRLAVAEYRRDKDGEHGYSYGVKIGKRGGGHQVIKKSWTPVANTEIKHVE